MFLNKIFFFLIYFSRILFVELICSTGHCCTCLEKVVTRIAVSPGIDLPLILGRYLLDLGSKHVLDRRNLFLHIAGDLSLKWLLLLSQALTFWTQGNLFNVESRQVLFQREISQFPEIPWFDLNFVCFSSLVLYKQGEIANMLANAPSPQPTFLVELSRVLANPGNSQVARVAAGLQIKNSLTSKDPDIKAQYQQRWLAIDANARREVKNYVSDCPILDVTWSKEQHCKGVFIYLA
jgi:hypothetical protein